MRTSSPGASAIWFLGDIQGVYEFHWLLRGDDSHDGRMIWKIYEMRTGASRYSFVEKFEPPSQKGRQNWWGYTDKSKQLHLDGRVAIVATRRSGTVAVDDVRLKQVDLLSEMKPAAKQLCEAGVIKALKLGAAIPVALAGAVVLVYAAPLAAAGGVPAIKLRAAQALQRVLPGVTAKDMMEDAVKDWVIDKATDYVKTSLGKIWDNAVESYQYGCNDFRAPWTYLRITLGYGDYADDLAETWNVRRR